MFRLTRLSDPLKRLAAWYASLPDTPPSGRISVDDQSFSVYDKGKFICRIDFDDVTRMEAYKRDELTTDLICFDVTTGSGTKIATWFIHEELAGWQDLVPRLEQLPGFRGDWYAAIVQPPFAENRTVVFRRAVPDPA